MSQEPAKQRPFYEAKLEYEQVTHNLNVSKRNWQLFAYIALIALILSLCGNIVLAMKSRVIVYLAEADKFGRATAIGPVDETKVSDEKFVRAFLYRYIDNARSIISDSVAMKKNLNEVYLNSKFSVQNNFLNPYYAETEPFTYASTKGTKQVEPTVFLKQGENLYNVEWQETERDFDNKVVGQSTYKALISVEQVQLTKEEKLKENPMNPFGLYITSLSWSKIQ